MKLILRLTRDMGVNLAGVDVVLRLRDTMERMEAEIEQLREELHGLNRPGSVPSGKAIVKRSHYDIIIFEE
jgi:MerR family transcriptional regulator/heat shock protein HspR